MIEPPRAAAKDRRALLTGFLAAYLILGLLLRLVLCVAYQPAKPAAVVLLGSATDLLVGTLLAGLAGLFLSLSGGASLARPRLRLGVLVAAFAGLAFLVAVEWFFFEEFESRFNHITLDYLLFPGEVATNIWESYSVPVWAGLALAVGAALAWPLHRRLRGARFAPIPWRRRLAGAGVALLAVAGAGLALRAWPSDPLGDRKADQVASNGLLELARAVQTAQLDYDAFYRTVPEQDAHRIAAEAFGWPAAGEPQKELVPARPRERGLDVVVVLEESLGSEFVGALGGAHACTPGLDRWSREGLLLTNLVSTGNRTVRGLEGVLCSFVPLPGDSVWKRDNSNGMATLAGAYAASGYRTTFVYGGAGTFDGMKPFALANGWQSFVEDGLLGSSFPSDAFRTAWGVADEHIFDAVLDQQRAAARDGAPLFATVLTTSNHKPFLTPDTKDPRRSTSKVFKWGGVGLALLAGLTTAWFFTGRSGRSRVVISSLVLLPAYGIWFNFKLQPSDSRQHAVAYADRALAGWLDRARDEGLLEHTVVLVVGDHGARVYGSAEIPAASYRIPALFLAPDPDLRGRRIEGLCSQVDLAPTLLSLSGVTTRAPFLGTDLLRAPEGGPGRAWLIHNRSIGLLTDDRLVVLEPKRSTIWYRRADRASDDFEPIAAPGPDEEALADRAAACFQVAEELYGEGRFRLGERP